MILKRNPTATSDDGPMPMLPVDATPYDPDDPKSVVNLVPDALREAALNLPIRFFKYTERDLRRSCNPTPMLCRLRLQFWDEYAQAQDSGRKMSLEYVLRGVCSSALFYTDIIRDENQLGFMMVPPKDYMLSMREMLDLGWERMRDVLEMPFVREEPWKDKNGNFIYEDEERKKVRMRTVIDHKLISEIEKITAKLDIRVKGAIVQKMQIQSQNVNVNQSATLVDASMDQLEAMEKKLLGIKKELGSLNATKEDEAVIIDGTEKENLS